MRRDRSSRATRDRTSARSSVTATTKPPALPAPDRRGEQGIGVPGVAAAGDPRGEHRDIEALPHRHGHAPGQCLACLIKAGAREVDPGLQDRCPVPRLQSARACPGTVQVAGLYRGAALQRVTQAAKRTGRVRREERARLRDALQGIARAAISQPDPGEQQLAHQREGRADLLADRDRLLEQPLRGYQVPRSNATPGRTWPPP